MSKVYELVYHTYDAYWHIACSLDRDKLVSLINQAKQYNPAIELPSDFPLRKLDWFDIDDFLSDYDSNFIDYFEILERELL